MTEATPIYRAIMVECERRRLQLGLPMWQVDDLAGTQDGYYAKALYPDTNSGRQAQWPSLQLIVTALFPEGFDVVIKPQAAPALDPAAQRSKIRSAVAYSTSDRKQVREHMRELGRKGAAAAKIKLTAKQISRIRKLAAKKRWKMVRKQRRYRTSAAVFVESTERALYPAENAAQ